MIIYLKVAWQKLIYAVCYKPYLHRAGRKVALFSPIRIEGKEFIAIDDNASIQAQSWLYATGTAGKVSLKIGKGCILGYNNHITAISDVEIGEYVLTANNVYISDNFHAYEDIKTPILKQPVKFKGKVKIGDGSWLGENVCVIGASVGKNSVIGSNSVVTKDIPDYSIAVGSPAKVIKQYDLASRSWIKVNG